MQWRQDLKGLNVTDRSVKTAKNHAGTLSPKRRKDANFLTWSSRNVERGERVSHRRGGSWNWERGGGGGGVKKEAEPPRGGCGRGAPLPPSYRGSG